MIIKKTIISHTGKKVDLVIHIENARITGTATVNGQSTQMQVTGHAIVQGRRCLIIKGGPAPYLPIDNELYEEIQAAAKAQYQDSMADEKILEGRVSAAQAKYERLFAQGYDNAQIIRARDEWDRLSAEYHQRYG